MDGAAFVVTPDGFRIGVKSAHDAALVVRALR
jgi:hypothetical protein